MGTTGNGSSLTTNEIMRDHGEPLESPRFSLLASRIGPLAYLYCVALTVDIGDNY